MLRPRIIPVLLIRDKGLVKTVNFNDGKYVGDPINAVKIFNEKEADELIVLDIDATSNNLKPNFDLIEKIALECRMPLCYGGGIKDTETAKKIIELGVEKVALSSAIIDNPELINSLSNVIGRQSVVAVLDYKRTGLFKSQTLFTKNGKSKTKFKLLDFVKIIKDLGGVGELVLNSIDKDGTMSGYDFENLKLIRNIYDGQITILGGSSDLENIKELISKFPIIGAAAGSTFVFKGKYKAVLINYPNPKNKLDIINEANNTIL